MQRYMDGDSAAFQELYGRYEHKAYAFFFRRTRSDDRAKDLYQELFLRVHRGRAAFDPSRPFAPWFFQIANHLLVDDLRRAFRSHEISLGDTEWAVEADARQAVENAERVEEVLAQLSPEERYVLLSAKIEGVGYPELAERLGKSAVAVKKLASRAMQRLRAAAAIQEHGLPPSVRA
jgi:RNA polymerase sigma-70 factor (ECF subfamily)